MRFNEKLQYLRKEKKLSQEQLADMLDVTRQSVSKWESGTTYPEMDKLIMLCKIFKCSLDDLTNDEISEVEVEKRGSNNTFTLNNILDSFFGFIGKTVKMFQTMSFGQIVKCALSLFVLAMLLMILYIPFDMLDGGLGTIIMQFGHTGWIMLLSGTISLILHIVFFILYVMIFVYIFKVAYLDKYEFVSKMESKEEKKTYSEEKKSVEEVKIVEAVGEPKDNAFLKILGGIVVGFIKFLLACFAMPIIFFLVILALLLVMDIYFMFDGLVFLGIFLGIIFAIVLCIWFLEAIGIFIFNRKIPFKRLIATFIVGLTGMGMSMGIFLLEVYNIDYINQLPEEVNVVDKKTEVVPMSEDLTVTYNIYDGGFYIDYVVDESLGNDVLFELSYYSQFVECNFEVDGNKVRLHKYYSDDFNSKKKLLKLIKRNLQNKKVYDYSKLYDKRLVVRGSKANIDKVEDNSYASARQFEIDRYNNYYEIQIEQYEETISNYEDKINSLNEEIDELQTKIEELEDYKSRVQGILVE